MRWVGSAGSIVVNPDGSYGLFLSGAWAADGDSDSFNQIFYSQSTDGENWSVPTPVVSTDYSFAASPAQENTTNPLGISVYYEGRAYGASVVQNPDGSLTMLFAGYRLPKTVADVGGPAIGTGSSQWTIGTSDPALYRNILVTTLTSATTPTVATTTTMTTPPTSPAVVGQTESVSATVAPVSPGTGTPTGTVSFSDGGATALCSGTLDEATPDTASCTYTYSGPQSSADNVTADYGSDSNYASSVSASTPVMVDQDSTTTSTPSASNGGNPANPAVVGEPVTLSSTVSVDAPGSGSPGGSVSFSDDLGQICSATVDGTTGIASCTYTPSVPTAVAGDSIIATYGGDTNDAASTSDALAEVVDKASTTSSLTMTPSTPLVGQSVTLSATVTPTAPGAGTPTGTVTFVGNGGTLCSASLSGSPATASCTTTYSSVTSDSITASYSGDGNFVGSSAGSILSVGQAMTATAVVPSDPTPVVGEQITYTATVTVTPPGSGTPTGSVTFTGNDDATLCASVPVTVSGTATCQQAYSTTGTEDLRVTYSGDTDFAGSSSSTSLVVGQDATTTTVTSDPSNPVAGQSITLTATVGAQPPGAGTPTGAVSFTSGGSALCSANLVNGFTDAASCTTSFSGGSSGSIIGTYAGDANFNGSSGSTNLTVGQGASTTTLSSSANPSVYGEPVTFTTTVAAVAPAAGTPTGSVTFALADPAPTKGPGHLPALACENGDVAALANGQAMCTISAGLTLVQSPVTVKATYSGETGVFTGSTATQLTQTVDKSPSTVTVSAKANPTITSKAASFSAIVAAGSPGAGHPTGTVTWTITSRSASVIPCQSSNDAVNKTSGKMTCNVAAQELFAASGPYTVTVATRRRQLRRLERNLHAEHLEDRFQDHGQRETADRVGQSGYRDRNRDGCALLGGHTHRYGDVHRDLGDGFRG